MKVEKYKFKPKKLPMLSGFQVEDILRAISEGRECFVISTDLGLTFHMARVDQRSREVLSYRLKVPFETLENISQYPRDHVYVITGDETLKLAKYANRKYYKLKVPKLNAPPTLEISGIHMHRILEVDPWTDSKLKVESARVKPGDKVLDTCTGLGYTASWSLIKGAKKVVTVEVDVTVLEFATYNPWSQFLSSERVSVIVGDVLDVVERFSSGEFNVIIHDPPRISIAGELYSREFYRKLYRVLREGGVLYHYTGEPLRIRSVNVAGGVIKRLKEAGFKTRKAYQGVLAFKA